VNLRIEPVEVFNLSLKTCSLKIRSANLGNLSVSGGESLSGSRYGHRAFLKTLPAAHDRYIYVFCARQVQIQNCH
jgi:hypothetical protein